MNSIEDKLEALNKLREQVNLYTSKAENKKQEIHDCKRQLSIISAMKSDYYDDLNKLDKEQQTKVANLKQKIKQLQKNKAAMCEECEIELSKKSAIIDKLKKQLQTAKQSESSKEKDANEKSNFIELENQKNVQLKRDLSSIKRKLEEMNSSIELLKFEGVETESLTLQIEEEISEATQLLETKTKEADDLEKSTHRIREEIKNLEVQLGASKEKPLDLDKRGNSMFGVVEDSRIQLQDRYQRLNTSYMWNLKHVVNEIIQMMKLLEVTEVLTSQLNVFIAPEDKCIENIETFENQLTALESKLEQCKNEILKKVPFEESNLPQYVVDSANISIRSRLTDIIEVGDRIIDITKDYIQCFIEIKQTNAQLQTSTRVKLQLKTKLNKLKYQELKMEILNSFPEIGKLLETANESVHPSVSNITANVSSCKHSGKISTSSSHPVTLSLDKNNQNSSMLVNEATSKEDLESDCDIRKNLPRCEKNDAQPSNVDEDLKLQANINATEKNESDLLQKDNRKINESFQDIVAVDNVLNKSFQNEEHQPLSPFVFQLDHSPSKVDDSAINVNDCQYLDTFLTFQNSDKNNSIICDSSINQLESVSIKEVVVDTDMSTFVEKMLTEKIEDFHITLVDTTQSFQEDPLDVIEVTSSDDVNEDVTINTTLTNNTFEGKTECDLSGSKAYTNKLDKIVVNIDVESDTKNCEGDKKYRTNIPILKKTSQHK